MGNMITGSLRFLWKMMDSIGANKETYCIRSHDDE